MPLATPLSVAERARIDAFVIAGHRVAQISEQLSRSRSCISRYIQRKTYTRVRQKVGRKKILLPQYRRRVIRAATNRAISAAKIVHELEVPCSKSTILRTLRDCEHIKYKKFAKMPLLTGAHINRRMAWCTDHLDWRQEWESVIFSDEKKFNLDGPDGMAYYWHDTRTVERTRIARQNGGGSVMIWAAIGWNGRTRIHFVDGILNADGYINVLATSLLPSLGHFAVNPPIFQQDNASIHSARVTRAWLEASNIDVLPWPAKSPDLNPIENLWGKLTQMVYAGGRQFQSKQALKDAIVREWNLLPQEYIRTLISSMVTRVAKVYNMGGNYIGY